MFEAMREEEEEGKEKGGRNQQQHALGTNLISLSHTLSLSLCFMYQHVMLYTPT